nr:metal homeostatis protein bsd2 [Quercus suber]
MSAQRYARVAREDAEDHEENSPVPNSPPPSFRSRASSRRPSRDGTDPRSEEERNLNDAFDAPSDDESDGGDAHDERRLIQSVSPSSETIAPAEHTRRPAVPQRNVTEIPTFAATTSSGRAVGNSQANDGVFANLSAKPRPGEDLEEKPPTYEQAAADATPPYWETTVLSPYNTTGNPDDVFVDGLLVGSVFSFVWNALISMSFQLIGFLLTYLLHTTHAAKHGSRTGLGLTFIHYGFQMRYAASRERSDPGVPPSPMDGIPDDPNSHDFDPDTMSGPGPHVPSGLTTNDWLSYALMIVGWFILIRAVSDFLRARRQEALVRSSPDRGLGVAVVAEGESPESSA